MGKAGSGKDAICKAYLNKYSNEMNFIVSHTTRPPREKEIDHQDYHFVDKNFFLNKIQKQEMLEYSEFRKWYYGTAISSLSTDKINLGIFNPTGIKTLYNKIDLTVVYIDVPRGIRLQRQLNRESNPDINEINRRFGTDEEDFKDIYNWNIPILTLSNNTIEELHKNVDIIHNIALGKLD